jgi:hypothetical protein
VGLFVSTGRSTVTSKMPSCRQSSNSVMPHQRL